MFGVEKAFLLAFTAAWLHAGGNVFLGRRREPEAAVALMLLIGVVAFAPIAALTWRVDADAIPYIVASAALELGYFAFLAAAYREPTSASCTRSHAAAPPCWPCWERS